MALHPSDERGSCGAIKIRTFATTETRLGTLSFQMGNHPRVAGNQNPDGAMKRKRAIRIGLIADTHGLLDPAVMRHFEHVDRILHAGDIGHASVIRQLQTIAPVTAVSGNVDGYGRSGYPSERIITMSGRRIALRHILYEGGRLTKEGRVFLERAQPDICIFGHTHQPKVEQIGKTLLINPGSAGPKRFHLPRAIAILTIGTKLI